MVRDTIKFGPALKESRKPRLYVTRSSRGAKALLYGSLCPPWTTSIPADLCQSAVPPRAASSGLRVLREMFLHAATSKILTTEALEFNPYLIWTCLKYWYWLRAKELSRVAEGRGGSSEEVMLSISAL